jgi:hypothetical protein
MNDNMTIREDTEKDPATLEREIGQTRAELNETLDRLERKLTPGQLLDQCLGFLGKSGSELGTSLGDAVKENPMPALLTATGITWMMFSPGRDSSARSYDYTGDVDSGYGHGDAEQDTLSEKIKSGTTSARSQLTSSKDTVKETFNKTTDAAKQSVSQTTYAVKENVNKTANLAQAQARRARQGFNSLLEEQPLIIGALGIAIGAAIGAALPSTEQEDRFMGGVRDKALANAKELGATTYEKGRDAARQKVEEVTQATTSSHGTRSSSTSKDNDRET